MTMRAGSFRNYSEDPLGEVARCEESVPWFHGVHKLKRGLWGQGSVKSSGEANA
jgi:hypothetical protein